MSKIVVELMLRFIVVLALLASLGNATTTNQANGLVKIYAGCVREDAGKLCFGLPDPKCLTTKSCFMGAMISDNETFINIRTGFDLRSPTLKESYQYGYGIDVDPFEKNDIGSTTKSICKDKVSTKDLIVRIFRGKVVQKNQSLEEEFFSNNNQLGDRVFSIPKHPWSLPCDTIVNQYDGPTNPLRIVFQNKAYFDMIVQQLQVVSGSIHFMSSPPHGFNDPSLYSSKDCRIYQNFNLPPHSKPETSECGKSGSSQPRIGEILNLLLLYLIRCL